MSQLVLLRLSFPFRNDIFLKHPWDGIVQIYQPLKKNLFTINGVSSTKKWIQFCLFINCVAIIIIIYDYFYCYFEVSFVKQKLVSENHNGHRQEPERQLGRLASNIVTSQCSLVYYFPLFIHMYNKRFNIFTQQARF